MYGLIVNPFVAATRTLQNLTGFGTETFKILKTKIRTKTFIYETFLNKALELDQHF